MKLTQYIFELEKIKEEHGDLQVANRIIREQDGEEFLEYVGVPKAEIVENALDSDTEEPIVDQLAVILETRLD